MTTPQSPARTHLGRPRKIIDGLEKLVGRAPYVADQWLPGLLHARPVLSPYPHARIRGIDRTAALAVPGVHSVLLGADLNVKPMHSRPSLLLAEDLVVFAGQPVALILALLFFGGHAIHSFTATMIFGVAEIVSYLSRFMTLLPGDVIARPD